MRDYVLVKSTTDKKDRNKFISVVWDKNGKIGFPFNEIEPNTLCRVTKVVDREKHFKFEGRAVTNTLPSPEALNAYCDEHDIPMEYIYAYQNIILISFVDRFYLINRRAKIMLDYYLTEVDGTIVEVEPFTASASEVSVPRTYKEFALLKNAEVLDDKDLISFLVREYCGCWRLDCFRYFKNLKIIAQYDLDHEGNRHLNRTYIGTEAVLLSDKMREAIEDATKHGEFVEFTAEQIKNYMKANFIRKDYHDGALVDFHIESCGSRLDLTALNAMVYNAKSVTDKERETALASKERLDSFRKSIARQVGTKTLMKIAQEISYETALNL